MVEKINQLESVILAWVVTADEASSVRTVLICPCINLQVVANQLLADAAPTPPLHPRRVTPPTEVRCATNVLNQLHAVLR